MAKDSTVWDTPEWTAVLKNCKKVSFDTRGLFEELLEMQRRSKIGRLSLKKLSAERIRNAVLDTTGLRSRAVEILVSCKKAYNLMYEYTESAKIILLYEYENRDPLSHITTKTDRTKVLYSGIRKRVPQLRELEQVIEAAEYVIDDLDQSMSAARLMRSTYEIATRPEMSG